MQNTKMLRGVGGRFIGRAFCARRGFTTAPKSSSSDPAEVQSIKKRSNKTAEGGADKDIRPVNKQLRDLIAGGQFQAARELFNKLKTEGPKPNVPTYNIMTNLFKAENDLTALSLLQEERSSSFKAKRQQLDPLYPDNDTTEMRPKPQRKYRPAYRTGPHALLRALLTAPNAQEGIGKDELISFAQPMSDVSFTVPTDYNGFYTAWNSMATLIQRGLVEKMGGVRSAQSEMGTTYRLSEAGLELAQELQTEAREIEEGKRPVPTPAKRVVSASDSST